MDVKIQCLGVLTFGDASGYEIKKQFEEGPFAYFHAAGFGSIYPALAKLMEGGCVTCTEMAQSGRPDKKVYRITPKGMKTFKQALTKTPAPDKVRSESLFILFFGHLLAEDERRQIYDDYLEKYRDHVACMAERDVSGEVPGRQFLFQFGKAFYLSVIEFMENNRHLLFEDDDRSNPHASNKSVHKTESIK